MCCFISPGGGGLAFLAKKYWHPTRPDNLERVFLAEESDRNLKRRHEELLKERQDERVLKTYHLYKYSRQYFYVEM